MSRLVVWSLLPTFGLALLGVAAQTPDPQRPTFRTEANFVRVDAYPTKDGAPLRDLTAADFELLEDGAPQRIETFEYVHVQPGVSTGREPNTVRESRLAVKDPRARVFVLFLDVPHVTMAGSWNVRAPLVRLLDRILAPDDLVGVMTPMMSAADVVFARKTDVIAGGLHERWPWGERFTLAEDARERLYRVCYPWSETAPVVDEMVERRRERTTLDALHELVTWLRDEREERKAILTVSEGWRLFGRNDDLTRPRVLDRRSGATEPIPGPAPIGVGPDGRLRLGHTDGPENVSRTECDADRQYLAQIDNDRYFRDIIEAANRANASFYTVDPRGLPVFDAPLGPAAPPPPAVDQRNLRHRIDTLRVLAANTDGLAVVDSNDIEKGLRRMADDLTSYYLLGYYSTNTRLDGRFRSITVRVTRPGVDVRARRGYQAPTASEVAAARASVPPAVSPAAAATADALAALARIREDAPLAARAVLIPGPALRVAGELAAPLRTAGSADAQVSGGDLAASERVSLRPGQRGFTIDVPLPASHAGAFDVRVRVRPEDDGAETTERIRVETTDAGQPVILRRGPATGNRAEPAGRPRFSRTERIRFEWAAPAQGQPVVRILDRNGAALPLPVTVTERRDPEGHRWTTADVVLAALAAGDYLLEFTSGAAGEAPVLTPFRVTG